MAETSALKLQQISWNFLSQSWLFMDNHIALNFFSDSQREIYSVANMSCSPHASTTGKVGQCD